MRETQRAEPRGSDTPMENAAITCSSSNHTPATGGAGGGSLFADADADAESGADCAVVEDDEPPSRPSHAGFLRVIVLPPESSPDAWRHHATWLGGVESDAESASDADSQSKLKSDSDSDSDFEADFESESTGAPNGVNERLLRLATERLRAVIERAAVELGLSRGEITLQLLHDPAMRDLHRRFMGEDSTTDVLTFDMDATDDRAPGVEPGAEQDLDAFARLDAIAEARTGGDPEMDVCQSKADAAERSTDVGTTAGAAGAPSAPLGTARGVDGDFIARANPLHREAIDVNIALCVDEAARQAADRDHDPTSELILYAVHGLLHCLGHDDHEPEAYERMHAIEDELLDRLGVGARFKSSPAAESDEAT